MESTTVKAIVSKRAKRIATFISYVAVMNKEPDTSNDILLMTDFAEIRFTPSLEQESSFFTKSIRAIEDGIVDNIKDEDAEVINDGAYIVIPQAIVKYYGLNTVANVHGMVLFVDSVKGMTMGKY